MRKSLLIILLVALFAAPCRGTETEEKIILTIGDTFFIKDEWPPMVDPLKVAIQSDLPIDEPLAPILAGIFDHRFPTYESEVVKCTCRR